MAQAEVRQFDAKVEKILHHVIYSLYVNDEIVLRELISNGSDACEKARQLMLSDQNFKIRITIDKAKNLIIVHDNGIGMTKQELIDNLGTIARSGTEEFLNSYTADQDKKGSDLIGQFGVGFYSAFMIAEKVEVVTKKIGETQSYLWSSDGSGEYSIEELDDTEIAAGTTVTLHIKSNKTEFLERYKVQHIIKTYSEHIPFPIELAVDEGEPEVVSSGVALWTKPKGEVSDEQYKEFYQHIAHAPDEPWMTLHYNIEGQVEYTALLYIPSHKPFDLFHPDGMTRVKLYIKRVFITEDNQKDKSNGLIPTYLRFLRGVVDCQDLPLNISREVLQNNMQLRKVRKSIVKKILAELKKKMDTDNGDYLKFWDNFGEVLKEGLCDGMLEERDQLLEICRFKSNNSADTYIGLDEYIANMLDNQEQIYYYLTGQKDKGRAISSPQLEGFNQRGIEVLLLNENVDDFWVQVISNYKGKNFCSITKSDIDLNLIKPISNDNQTSEEQAMQPVDDYGSLTSYIKATLGDIVSEVKVSNKLVDSPSCLAIPEGAMDIRMERYLLAQKQLQRSTPKILEINPQHHLLKRIAEGMEGARDGENEDLINILFDQACILEGEQLRDPLAYVRRLNDLLKTAI